MAHGLGFAVVEDAFVAGSVIVEVEEGYLAGFGHFLDVGRGIDESGNQQGKKMRINF